MLPPSSMTQLKTMPHSAALLYQVGHSQEDSCSPAGAGWVAAFNFIVFGPCKSVTHGLGY